MLSVTETFIVDEEDGPSVGILCELDDGSQVWSGECSNKLFDEQDPDDREALGDATGVMVMVALPGEPTRIVARAADAECGIEIARSIACRAAIAKTAQP